jgi:cadmium resistance protein CadD (predicted permease)
VSVDTAWRLAAAVGGRGNVARMKRLLGQFICTLLIVAFVLHFIWWIVGAGVVVAAAWFAVRVRRAWLAADDAERRRRAEIAARADQQLLGTVTLVGVGDLGGFVG